MKNNCRYVTLYLYILLLSLYGTVAFAQKSKPDTVKAGIYVTSIHDINFKDKEYTVDFWLWLKYKNKDFDFVNNLEIPQAKSISKSFSTLDSTGHRMYLLMKIQCVMKDSWAINNFPFDKQALRLSIENSQFDNDALVFVPDTVGKQYDPRFTLRGWNIDSLTLKSAVKKYETAFGDESIKPAHTEYSSFKVKINISRDALGLFLKMFLGMYVAFFIALMCFFIHADSIDSRFGLSVGSLFAVIGNKYIIDGSLPDSSSFTLVDMLHGLTLIFILVVIICTAISLQMIKKGKDAKADRLDRRFFLLLLVAYVLLNAFLIIRAGILR